MEKMTLKQVFKNRKKIFEGIYYSIFKSKYVEKIASERRAICNVCPFHDLKGDKCYVKGTQPCCGKCGCSDQFKLRSLSSSCGDEQNPRWKAVMTEEQEKKFTKNIKDV